MTATSDGRTVVTAQLTVIPEAPASISRFVVSPKGGTLGGGESTPEVTVRPGSEIVVLLADGNPGRNEDALTVKSKAFEGPLTIRTESADDPGCKCDDGSIVYAGHTTLRDDVPAGTYSLKVVSHHGKKTSTTQLVVTGEPVTHHRAWLAGEQSASPWWAPGVCPAPPHGARASHGRNRPPCPIPPPADRGRRLHPSR